ncbi:thioredoxin-like protein [Cokeromyces recurvatus]|uniref:thioredoxin-like protein n=1 Tax=Cokeromyces recurvatus TaxID=90255 RepID=UPI00221F35C2|nr:thioredoxin-like protein [Cokeromyces recurvatus]KAI7900930.1 thioredoxin-like protein [Cokeromyces recurvatus]
MVKKTFLFTAIAATFAALTHSVLADSDVLSLTEKTFDQEVLNQDLMLVEFFAPWCGHCKALAPEYEIAATKLKDKMKVAKVDCTENQDLCIKYGVRGYPTLKVFRNGETSDYKGSRKADGIVSYMIKQAAPAVTPLDSSNFTEFQSSDRVVIVGYGTDEATQQALSTVAEKLREDFLFGLVTDPTLAAEHKAAFPSIVLYKQFDEGRSDLVSTDAAAIEKFVMTESVPLLDNIDGSNFAYYVNANLPLAFVFHDSTEQQDELRPVIQPLAQKYKGRINFVFIDANKFGAHANNLALKQGEWPAFAIQHLDNGAKYPFDQSKALTSEDLPAFLEEYTAGKLQPTLKSAEAPVDNNGPVKVVVAKEFNDIVLDKSMNVFLEVYAPWCGHCKRLAPIWEELGELASGHESLMIAKMDGTENDIPEEGGFEVTGFPTLKLFKAETNEMVDYNGDRSLEDLVKFLNEQTGLKINIESEKKDKEEEESPVNQHDEL